MLDAGRFDRDWIDSGLFNRTPFNSGAVPPNGESRAIAFAKGAANYAARCVYAAGEDVPVLCYRAIIMAAEATHWAALDTGVFSGAGSGQAGVMQRGLVDPATPVIDAAQSDSEIWTTDRRPDLYPPKLWPDTPPSWIMDLWATLKSDLLALDEDWDVWTDWYDARLAGKPSIKALEIARVLIEDEIWQQGPKVVNAEIKRLIEEHATANLAQTPQTKSQVIAHSSLDLGSGTLGAGPWLGGTTVGTPQTPDHAATINDDKRPRDFFSHVPAPRPAALEPIWKESRLVLPTERLATDVDVETIGAALKSLHDEITALVEDTEGDLNIDRRLIAYLHRVANLATTGAPAQDQLFRLAHAKDVLDGYSYVVNREWPEFLAQRFHKLVLHFDRCVRQFPKWREFVRNAEHEPLTAPQVAAVPQLATAFEEALKDEDANQFVDPVLADALQSLQSSLSQTAEESQSFDAIEAGKNLLAEDIVESINNILKRIVEVALACKIGIEPTLKGIKATAKEAMEVFGDEAHKSIVEEARRRGKNVGPAITRWVKRILYGGPALYGSTALIHHLLPVFPSAFQWLELIKSFF